MKRVPGVEDARMLGVYNMLYQHEGLFKQIFQGYVIRLFVAWGRGILARGYGGGCGDPRASIPSGPKVPQLGRKYLLNMVSKRISLDVLIQSNPLRKSPQPKTTRPGQYGSHHLPSACGLAVPKCLWTGQVQ